MTATAEEQLARLDSVLERLERLGLAAPPPEVEPLAAGDLPLHVAAGELITSAWGNSVVDRLARPLAYVRASSTDQGIAPSVNVPISWAGATNVLDPFAMVGSSGFTIPAGWGGLWTFHLAERLGSHGSQAETAMWVARPDGTRIAAVQPLSNISKAQRVLGSGTFSLLAGQLVNVVAYHLNSSAIILGAEISAAWTGISPV